VHSRMIKDWAISFPRATDIEERRDSSALKRARRLPSLRPIQLQIPLHVALNEPSKDHRSDDQDVEERTDHPPAPGGKGRMNSAPVLVTHQRNRPATTVATVMTLGRSEAESLPSRGMKPGKGELAFGGDAPRHRIPQIDHHHDGSLHSGSNSAMKPTTRQPRS